VITNEELTKELATAFRAYNKARANLNETSLILLTVLEQMHGKRDWLETVSKATHTPPLLVMKTFRELKKQNKG
jgi:nucleoid-associated protein YejK